MSKKGFSKSKPIVPIGKLSTFFKQASRLSLLQAPPLGWGRGGTCGHLATVREPEIVGRPSFLTGTTLPP